MKIGLIIIGDETLSGKRRDRHFAHVVSALAERGMELGWCRIIGDEPALISATLQQTFSSGDLVFCCGGIGAPPDDYPRAAAAHAAGVALVRHPVAGAEIEARFGAAGLAPARLLLAELPAGSRIIPNPYNRVPGFSVGRHNILPGFPEMAWPMMAWVLDTQYPGLRRAEPDVERILRIRAREGELLTLMQDFVAHHPHCRLSSLPEIGPEPRLELGVRGAAAAVAAGIAGLQPGLAARGLQWGERTCHMRGGVDESI